MAHAVGHQLAHQQLGVLRYSGIEERGQPGHGMARHARRHWRRRKAQEEEDVHRRAVTRFGSADTGKADKAAGCYPLAEEAKPSAAGAGPVLRAGLTAGAVAGVLSGLPSTFHALITGRDPLAAARAAGNLLLPADAPPGALLAAGGLAHVVVSLGWGTVLAVAVRRTSLRSWAAPAVGVAAGAAIAAVDLGLLAHGPAGRRWPLIRALPVGPQVAYHLAFGAVAGAVLRRRG